MENLFPIIGLVVYFLLTGLLRKRNKERQSPRPVRPQPQEVRQSAPPRESAAKHSGSVKSQEPERQFDSESDGKTQGYTDFQSMFSNVSDRVQETTRDSLLKQILGAFEEGRDLTQTESVIDEGAIEMDTDIGEVDPQSAPLDAKVPADVKIKEGESVFKQDLSQTRSKAYDVKLDSYVLNKHEITAEDRLRSVFQNRSILVRGIIMAEILGKPRAFSSSEYW